MFSNTSRKFLNYFTLTFLNTKIEQEFIQKFSNNRKKFNKAFGIIFFIFSIVLWIWVLMLKKSVEDSAKELNVKFVEIKELNFTGQITNDLLKDVDVYYEKYVIHNLNYLNILNETSNFTSKSENSKLANSLPDLARKTLFTMKAMPMSSTIFVFHAVQIILIFLMKKDSTQNYLFTFLYFMSNLNYHVLGGILIVFYKFDSNSLLFIVVIEHFIRILLIFIRQTNWTYIISVCIVSIIFEWSVFLMIHYKAYQTIIFYFSISLFIHIVSIILSYYVEMKRRQEFHLIYLMNFDREYLMNFLGNFDHGFITLNSKEIVFINKSMNKIIENYSKLTNNIYYEKSENYEANVIQNAALKIDETKNFISPINVIPNNLTINPKEKIEKILENLSRINNNLPNEILDYFKVNNFQGHSLSNNNFRNNIYLEELFNVLKKCKIHENNNEKITKNNTFSMNINNFNNFSEFNYLGIINFKRKLKNQNVLIEDLNLEEILEKSYQVNFRLITHENSNLENENEFLEIMFSDISNVISHEREKTINNCRSLYLSKIAHEFKNPITSIVELSTSIAEKIAENNNNNSTKNNKKFQEILNMTDYTIQICKIMDLFLKDFSLITNIKFPCEKCHIFLKCIECLDGNICNKCNFCTKCVEMTHTTFDYKLIIFDLCETFKNFSKHEGKNISINLEFDNISMIKTQKDFFRSIIYNIIYYSYINIGRGQIIQIKVKKINLDEILFEINDSGLEIESHYLKKINEKFSLEKNDSFDEEDQSDKFNKFFNLFVALNLVKKIGSNLHINSDRSGNNYFFTIKRTTNKTKTSFSPLMIKPSFILEENSDISDSLNKTLSQKFNFTMINENPMFFNYQLDENNFFQEKDENVPEIFINGNTLSHKSLSDVFFDREKSIEVNSNLGFFKQKTLRQNSKNSKNSNFSNNSRKTRKTFKKKILIIDDEVLVRNTMKRFFRKIKESTSVGEFEIFEAENCFVAIDIIYKNFCKNIYFDYIIIDEYMPYMKGSTLIKLMKQLSNENIFYNINFISHTAFDNPEKKKFIMEAGAENILSKPVQYEDFKSFIDKLLKKVI